MSFHNKFNKYNNKLKQIGGLDRKLLEKTASDLKLNIDGLTNVQIAVLIAEEKEKRERAYRLPVSKNVPRPPLPLPRSIQPIQREPPPSSEPQTLPPPPLLQPQILPPPPRNRPIPPPPPRPLI